MTHFEWFEAKVGPQRAITAGDGTPSDGSTPVELTPLEHVRACLRMDEAKAAGDTRPTLVYFHWPHEHPLFGETTKNLCAKVLDDETTSRWGLLFRCVQVDMAASDKRLIALLGNVDKPMILVLDAENKALARLDGTASPGKMQKALKDALQKFPEEWKKAQREIADQEKQLEKAHLLAKDDKYADALAIVNQIGMAKVRIGATYDKALLESFDLSQRVERQQNGK